MKKKLLIIGVVLIGLIAAMVAFGSGDPTTTSANKDQLDTSITTQQLLQDPEAYKGKVVKVTGRIFNTEAGDGNTAFQIWSDPENSEGNIVVYISGANEAVANNNYVEVIGEVRGKFSGDNAFGASLSAPALTAIEVNQVDRNTAVAPALKTIEGKEQTKSGVTATVDKIEFAANETRVFLTIKNASAGTINFYDFNSKIVQDGSQVKEKTVFDVEAGTDIPSDILASTTETGVIFFEKADAEKDLTLHLEVTTADFSTVNFDFEF